MGKANGGLAAAPPRPGPARRCASASPRAAPRRRPRAPPSAPAASPRARNPPARTLAGGGRAARGRHFASAGVETGLVCTRMARWAWRTGNLRDRRGGLSGLCSVLDVRPSLPQAGHGRRRRCTRPCAAGTGAGADVRGWRCCAPGCSQRGGTGAPPPCASPPSPSAKPSCGPPRPVSASAYLRSKTDTACRFSASSSRQTKVRSAAQRGTTQPARPSRKGHGRSMRARAAVELVRDRDVGVRLQGGDDLHIIRGPQLAHPRVRQNLRAGRWNGCSARLSKRRHRSVDSSRTGCIGAGRGGRSRAERACAPAPPGRWAL